MSSVPCVQCGAPARPRFKTCSNQCHRERRREQKRSSRRKPQPPIVDLPGEEWRPVAGYEGFYAVSNMGRVRRLARRIDRPETAGGPFDAQEILLAQKRASRDVPYLRITLAAGAGKIKTPSVHTLVCTAFHGPKPSPEHEVRHLNGVHDDNRAENLAWGTRSHNMRDALRHGTHPQASKTHCPQGHPYDQSNTRVYTKTKQGWVNRVCRTCEKTRRARRRAA